MNDGVCDYDLCCDGSDEWEGVGGVKCPDRCKELGKEWRKQDEARQKALGAANKKRKELVAEAGRLRKEVEDRVQTLLTQIEAQEKRVVEEEKEVADIERKEKGRVKKSPAKLGKMGMLAGLARQRMDELRESLVRLRQERDSSKDRVKELEGILSTFKEEYNPNFNDEGVKRAVRAWEDYAARDKPSDGDAAHDRDLDEITKSDKENGLDWDEYTVEEQEGDVELREWMYTRLDARQLTKHSVCVRAFLTRSPPALGRPETARLPRYAYGERHSGKHCHRSRGSRAQGGHRCTQPPESSPG